MKKKKKPSRAKVVKTLKKKCDALWSKITKRRWAYVYGNTDCAWCKVRPGEHSDHIANRWKHSTRWTVDNCVVLCMPCHLFRKKREPAEWAAMVIETIGRDLYDDILQKSQMFFKVNPENMEKVLRYLEQLESSYGA